MRFSAIYPKLMAVLWIIAAPLALVLAGALILALTDVGDLPFDNLHLWWLLAAVPIASAVCGYAVVRRRRALRAYAGERLAGLLVSAAGARATIVRGGLLVTAVAMVVFGVLGPRWGIYLQKATVRGIDVAVLVDVSKSMLARDVVPNRLERMREEVRQQLTERAVFQGANRLALMVFAGSAKTTLPLTTDHFAFREKLEQVHTGMVGMGGTDVANALTEAIGLFERSPEQATKMLLLFTDGETHTDGDYEAARQAYEDHGIRLFTIGVGDPLSTTGAQVPVSADQPNKPMLYQGQIVLSKLDVEGLRKLADAGGGRYAPIEDLNVLVDAIAGMRQTELSTEERKRHKPRYQLFLAAALALLTVETLVGRARRDDPDDVTRVWQEDPA